VATTPGPNPLLQLTPDQVNRAESAQWRSIVRQALADTRCASPAFLVADMDAAAQTVKVQVAIQERVRTATGPQWWDVPPIVHVPVIMPRGGGYAITLPLKQGDEGLLIFCDTCFDLWWHNGQNNAPVAVNVLATAKQGGFAATASGSQVQNEIRRHYVHDCGFWPGMWSQPNVLTDYASDSLQIRTDDGTTTVIDVAQTGVEVTGAAVSVANGGTAQALMNDTFYQWYVTNIQPFLVSKGYVGPTVPLDSETTVLKAQ
jgi:Phage protein Gp138 N-terminal domain